MEDFRTEDAKQVFNRILSLVQGTPAPAAVSSKSKASEKTISSKEFTSKTLARMDLYEKKKHNSRERELKKKEAEVIYSFKPQINKKNFGTESTPLYKRANRIIQEKSDKIQELKEIALRRKEEQEEKFSFKPSITPTKGKKHRSFDNFYKDINNWKAAVVEKKEQQRLVKKMHELDQHSEKPTINRNSLEITKNAQPLEQRIKHSVEQWAYRTEEPETSVHSFSPQISDKAKGIKPAAGVFQRLYSLKSKHSDSFSERDSSRNIIDILGDFK